MDRNILPGHLMYTKESNDIKMTKVYKFNNKYDFYLNFFVFLYNLIIRYTRPCQGKKEKNKDLWKEN